MNAYVYFIRIYIYIFIYDIIPLEWYNANPLNSVFYVEKCIRQSAVHDARYILSVTNFETKFIFGKQHTLYRSGFGYSVRKKPLPFQVYSLQYFIDSIYIMRTRLISICSENGPSRILMVHRIVFLSAPSVCQEIIYYITES